MRNFVYGLIFGAVAAYLYVAHGAASHATLGSFLGWRDAAKGSVVGYGGSNIAKR